MINGPYFKFCEVCEKKRDAIVAQALQKSQYAQALTKNQDLLNALP